jgi:hypothetical protein
MTADRITFASAAKHGQKLAKVVHVKDGRIVAVEPAPKPFLHRFRQVEVGGLASLMAAIEEAARRGDIAVRGEPIEPIGRRAIYNHAEHGPAGLRIVPRRWCAFDWDNLPLEPLSPADEFANDPAELANWSTPDPLLDPEIGAREALSWLPPAFHDVAVGWQVSASAGFKPGWRMRSWHWLNHPTTGAELKTWLAPLIERNLVDDCTLTEAQPHYLAVTVVGLPGSQRAHRARAPTSDPCPRRFGVLRLAKDAVPFPDIAGIMRREQQAAERQRRPVPVSVPTGMDSATAFLERCVETVRTAIDGTKHKVYYHEAARARAFCLKYSIDWEPWKRALIETYEASLDPKEAKRRRKSSTEGVMDWVEAR